MTVRCFALTSGDKVLRLELESKDRCDNERLMAVLVRSIVNDAKIKETFENVNYTCCSSSCCNYNSVDTRNNVVTSTTELTNVNEKTKESVKSSKSSGKSSHFLLGRITG